MWRSFIATRSVSSSETLTHSSIFRSTAVLERQLTSHPYRTVVEHANESMVRTAPNVHQPGISNAQQESSVMAIAATTSHHAWSNPYFPSPALSTHGKETPPGTCISSKPRPSHLVRRRASATTSASACALAGSPPVPSASPAKCWIESRLWCSSASRVAATGRFGACEWTFLSGMTALWMGVQNAGNHLSEDAGLVVHACAWVGASIL